MTNSWRIGGVQLQLREDGHFSIYQPDSNRVMTRETALDVGCAIIDALKVVGQFDGDHDEDMKDEEYALAYTDELTKLATDKAEAVLTDTEKEADKNAELGRQQQSTVGGGVIATSDGPADASIRRGVADVEAGRVSEPKPAPRKRGPGRPRKTG